MIKIEDYKIFADNISTLKETSKDKNNNESEEFMTSSELEAINFDGVKNTYTNKLGLSNERASSFDALAFINNNGLFIEFKNGNMKNEKQNVQKKIRDGILIFCDIINCNISHTRTNIQFILVYNEEKNRMPNQLKKQIKSPANVEIASHYIEKGGNELIRFNLEKFKTLYFKEVHTYTEKEFEEYLTKFNMW